MKRSLYASAAIILILAGCATNKSLRTTEPINTNSVVNVPYEYNALEKPGSHMANALNMARDLCVAKGYREAEAFGQPKIACRQPSQSSCIRYIATVTYRCTGMAR
jgi:hypothetical protein